MKQNQTIWNWLILGGGVFLLGVSVWRAHTMAFTCDEATTFFNLVNAYSNWDILTHPQVFSTANNHILNTFFMRASVAATGNSDLLTLRWHSVLAHAIFLWFSWKTMRVLMPDARNGAAVAALWFFLNFNPYLLDFFPLARGYAWALAAQMACLYYFLTRQQIQLAVWSGVAVLSNFTWIPFVVLLFLVQNACFLWEFWTKKINFSTIIRQNIPLFLSLTISAAIVIRPIQILKSKGEFLFGNDHLTKTFSSILTNSVYGGAHLANHGTPLAGNIFGVLILFCIIFTLKIYNSVEKNRQLALTWLPVLMTAMMWLQYQIMGTKYLENRTALVLFPLLFLSFHVILSQFSFKITTFWAIILGGGILYHFGRTFNINGTKEWYYETENRNALQILEEKAKSRQKVLSIGASPAHEPSFSYHVQNSHQKWLTRPLFEGSIRTDSLHDFYFIDPSDTLKIEKHYEKYQQFGDMWLFRRRGDQ